MHYSREQILKMAPDDASVKAGQQLASAAKWGTRFVNERALWGDCQGSGKIPYRTMVDLGNIAFKCSCPSRKFPCKHGLGLILLYTSQPDLFSKQEQMPEPLLEWLGKRQEKEVIREEKEIKPVDEAAQAKRVATRERKVEGGIEELRVWIKDLVRTGIMNIPQNSYQFNQNIIARMVDAQAPGLANQLRQMNGINFYREGWQRALIKRLTATYLITDAFQRLDSFPEELKKELQTLIGWNTLKEDVLKGDALSDIWIVLSIESIDEGNIRTEKIWLLGKHSGRYAVILNFYANGQTPQHVLIPGMYIQAAVVYFPGLRPQRALIREYQIVDGDFGDIKVTSSILLIYENITTALVENPFIEQLPFVLNDIQVVKKDEGWFVVDQTNKGFTISNAEEICWRLLAFTMGRPCSCFGIYQNEQFYIHSLWLEDKTYFVTW